MSSPANKVAVVDVISKVDWCRCQWPTNRALALAEGAEGAEGAEEADGSAEPVEAVGPELALGVLVTAGAAELEATLVVEDAPVPDVFFEHPAAPAAASPAMAIANPDFSTETPIAMRPSLPALATTPRAQSTDWDTP